MVVKVKPLDITLVSAKGITDVNIFTKMSVYAVVVVTLSGKIADSKNTPVAERGGSNPIWDFPMKFVVDGDAAETGGHDLYIQLMCRRRFFRDKAIGLVHFPVTRLYDFAKGELSAFLITASVREGSLGTGEAKGKIKFSFRFVLMSFHLVVVEDEDGDEEESFFTDDIALTILLAFVTGTVLTDLDESKSQLERWKSCCNVDSIPEVTTTNSASVDKQNLSAE